MEKVKIYNVKVLTPNEIIDNGCVVIQNGKIENISRNNIDFEGKAIDGNGLYLSPGFVDIHVHGGGGCDFMDGSIEAYRTITKTHMLHGTTSMLPTTTTVSHEELKSAIKVYQSAKKQNLKCNLLGIHLEGPYVSKTHAGALDPEYIRAPQPIEYNEIIKLAGDDLVRWTIAPEQEGALELGKHLTGKSILPSVGHSDASYEDVLAAYSCGFTHITHLYSTMSTIKRVNGYRIAGVVESAYLIDDMYVEIIADGHHLPSSLIQYVYKFKNKDKIVLVTDAMRAAGQNVKYSTLGSLKTGKQVIIEDGVAKMLDKKAFAGSVATSDVLVRTMLNNKIPLIDAINMLSKNPIKVLNRNTKKGEISIGMDADLIMFDKDINVKFVMVNGVVMKAV